MYRGLLISSGFHVAIVTFSILALPFVAKKPLDIPPLISVELIQIAEKTNIPFAPKASKIIEKAKKENEKLLSEQAPPKKVKKDEKKEVQTDKKKNEIIEAKHSINHYLDFAVLIGVFEIIKNSTPGFSVGYRYGYNNIKLLTDFSYFYSRGEDQDNLLFKEYQIKISSTSKFI